MIWKLNYLSILVILLLQFGPISLAQSPTIGTSRENAETQFQAIATRFRKFQIKVNERLDEIKSTNDSIRDAYQKQLVREAEAQSVWEKARLFTEVAKVSFSRFDQEEMVQNTEVIQAKIALAKSNGEQCRYDLKERETLVAKLSQVAPANDPSWIIRIFEQKRSLAAEKLRVHMAEIELEAAQSELEFYQKYKSKYRQKELKDELEKAEKEEFKKKIAYSLERERLAQLDQKPTHRVTLTDAEAKALIKIALMTKAWKKLCAERSAFQLKDETRQKMIYGLINETKLAFDAAQNAWDDAQEIRAEFRDSEFDARVIQTLVPIGSGQESNGKDGSILLRKKL